ncbi:beta-N-acetylhexosaminidase [Marinibacterium profundimaris]|uniref:beta-N-acetylhexosaminidase n=1 Tax=Marinibacterium profundimaris TaxID=1679460 RepID=A0A225NSI4_9RHOB|nr:beta-N-acetylhexosaminidase [Marinibacterium profundimaris]OWU77803.1 beta-hexosaminidase [Marinibacterium profundimaris]
MSRPGATILDADGLRLTSDEKAFFRAADPFGFILFARNVDTADQLRALTGEMREAVGREAPILIDQEGGRVQRLWPPLARKWLPPLDFVDAAKEDAPRAMYLRSRLIADELKGYGIDTNCAPMLDLARDETHPFLRNRCYGSDPDVVAALGREAAQGFLDGGVLPVVKHMPGHGLARADSHHDLPTVRLPLEELSDLDFAPFRSLNDLPLGMTAHIVFDGIDAAPATLSPHIIGLIREDIGFDGLLMTDDISMKALSGSAAEITRRALEAGCDLVLHCNQPLPERMQVAEAAGAMTDAAMTRAGRALAARLAPKPLDIAAAEEELDALMRRGPGDD